MQNLNAIGVPCCVGVICLYSGGQSYSSLEMLSDDIQAMASSDLQTVLSERTAQHLSFFSTWSAHLNGNISSFTRPMVLKLGRIEKVSSRPFQ